MTTLHYMIMGPKSQNGVGIGSNGGWRPNPTITATWWRVKPRLMTCQKEPLKWTWSCQWARKISTWADLAETTPKQAHTRPDTHGDRARPMSLATWPQPNLQRQKPEPKAQSSSPAHPEINGTLLQREEM